MDTKPCVMGHCLVQVVGTMVQESRRREVVVVAVVVLVLVLMVATVVVVAVAVLVVRASCVRTGRHTVWEAGLHTSDADEL